MLENINFPSPRDHRLIDPDGAGGAPPFEVRLVLRPCLGVCSNPLMIIHLEWPEWRIIRPLNVMTN